MLKQKEPTQKRDRTYDGSDSDDDEEENRRDYKMAMRVDKKRLALFTEQVRSDIDKLEQIPDEYSILRAYSGIDTFLIENPDFERNLVKANSEVDVYLLEMFRLAQSILKNPDKKTQRSYMKTYIEYLNELWGLLEWVRKAQSGEIKLLQKHKKKYQDWKLEKINAYFSKIKIN
jgi:hypothetical protein